MCSIRERQHCRSGYKSIIVCSDDINTHERYLIRATLHTVTLSHLIDVETRLIYSSFFGGVSKVATHLDYDVLYLDVRQSRTTQPSFSLLIGDALQPQDGLFNQLLRWSMWYWCIIESLTIWTFFLLVSSIRRSTKKRFQMCLILEWQHCRSACEPTIVWSNDIDIHERYAIGATPHTVTLSHLIDVESRLIYLSFFGGVSKVATHLDYDVLYVDVRAARTDATVF